MLTLYTFGPAFGLMDLSPFVLKVHAYLKMAGIEYTAKTGDVRKAPKKKLPYIDHDGTIVSDSSHIVDYLKKKLGDPLDGKLTAKDHAVARAFQSMLEEDAYFTILYERWKVDEGWATYTPVFKNLLKSMGIPGLLVPLILGGARKGVVRSLDGQGTGRHTRAEVEEHGKRVVDALSAWLEGKTYFFGDAPASIDATVYAFGASVVVPPFPSKVAEHARKSGALTGYVERMKTKYGL